MAPSLIGNEIVVVSSSAEQKLVLTSVDGSLVFIPAVANAPAVKFVITPVADGGFTLVSSDGLLTINPDGSAFLGAGTNVAVDTSFDLNPTTIGNATVTAQFPYTGATQSISNVVYLPTVAYTTSGDQVCALTPDAPYDAWIAGKTKQQILALPLTKAQCVAQQPTVQNTKTKLNAIVGIVVVILILLLILLIAWMVVKRKKLAKATRVDEAIEMVGNRISKLKPIM
jgi:hypothetical protein